MVGSECDITIPCNAGSASTVIAPVGISVPSECAAILARALLSTVDARMVLAVTDLPAHAFSGGPSPDGSGQFRFVATGSASPQSEAAAKGGAANRSKSAPIVALPPGDMLTGLAAAVLSSQQVLPSLL